MKPNNEVCFETLALFDEVSAMNDEADDLLDERAEQLFRILQEVEGLSEDLTDEQFCGLVHQAVTACGFVDAIDAWVSLIAVTERRIALIDFRDVTPLAPDTRN